MTFSENFEVQTPSLLQATVLSVSGSGVFVTLDSGVPGHSYGPCPAGAWTTPTAGASCLVARDELGGYWIVSW